MAIANRLFDDIQQLRAAQTLGDLLAELVERCERHFQYEESLFHALRNAKAAAAHKADHDIFRNRLEAIQTKFEEQPAASHSLLALAALRDYLLEHIKTFDAELETRIDSESLSMAVKSASIWRPGAATMGATGFTR